MNEAISRINCLSCNPSLCIKLSHISFTVFLVHWLIVRCLCSSSLTKELINLLTRPFLVIKKSFFFLFLSYCLPHLSSLVLGYLHFHSSNLVLSFISSLHSFTSSYKNASNGFTSDVIPSLSLALSLLGLYRLLLRASCCSALILNNHSFSIIHTD